MCEKCNIQAVWLYGCIFPLHALKLGQAKPGTNGTQVSGTFSANFIDNSGATGATLLVLNRCQRGDMFNPECIPFPLLCILHPEML